MENSTLLPVTTSNCESFHTAIANGSIRVVKRLLNYGIDANISSSGFTPLHTAVIHNQRRIAQLLISMGADVNRLDAAENPPIWYAVESNNVKITKLLIASGAVVSNYPWFLTMAVMDNCIRIVKLLLKHGVDVNGSDEYGETALSTASSLGFDEMIHVLVEAGANLHAVTSGLNTPLHIATEQGHCKTVETLLKFGANVDALSILAVTALQIAAQRGNCDMVETLLKFGANVNTMDDEGNTALYLAAAGTHANVLPILLSHGADINLTTLGGETPIECAIAGLTACNFFHKESRSYRFRSGCQCNEAVNILTRHVVKLEHKKCYISEQNWQAIGNCKKTKVYYLKCKQEWNEMERFKFPTSFISFRDILVKDVDCLAILMENEDIRWVSRSRGYKSYFPIYSKELQYNIQLGVERRQLMKKSRIIFSELPFIPELCVYKILGYVSTDDLKLLVTKLVEEGSVL